MTMEKTIGVQPATNAASLMMNRMLWMSPELCLCRLARRAAGLRQITVAGGARELNPRCQVERVVATSVATCW